MFKSYYLKMTITRFFCLLIASQCLLSCSSSKAKSNLRSTARSSTARFNAGEDDPYLWLEPIDDKKALAWVEKHNTQTLTHLTSLPTFEQNVKDLRDVLLANDRIPVPTDLNNGYVYNFWKDKTHSQGLLRKQNLDDYGKPNSRWETILDLDELSKKEKVSWVYAGSICVYPQLDRCLIRLSNLGEDAVTVREFDMQTHHFVEPQNGGFFLNTAKSTVAWLDENTLLVGTNFGENSLTDSGYPKFAKVWKRGTPLTDAKTVFEANVKDVEIDLSTTFQPEGNLSFISLEIQAFLGKFFLLDEKLQPKAVAIPKDAAVRAVEGKNLFVSLRSDLLGEFYTFHRGDIVNYSLENPSDPNPELVLPLKDRQSFDDIVVTKKNVYVAKTENIQGRISKLDKVNGAWKETPLEVPALSSLGFATADRFSEKALVRVSSFLVPETIYSLDEQGVFKELIKAPHRFSEDLFTAEQWESTSKDGTKIPYFIIHKKTMSFDGSNPTLLYGYGGFEISLLPSYLSTQGKVWLEKGGVYVVANIRGGGEFGPAWHAAAIRENRQVAYNDFISIAEDLIQRKVTSPKHLGIMGGSNGGLLMGAMLTQRPELFNAIVIANPLLDMLRYTKMPQPEGRKDPGSSWIGEYGDPDVAFDRNFIAKYSPYQNIRFGQKYPTVLLLTSSKDDRVHPGHARKMAAKLEQNGYPVLFFEDTAGGHAAAVNLEQSVQRYAMIYSYLQNQLK